MCLEDIRLGRKQGYSAATFIVSAAETQILVNNPNRVSITLSISNPQDPTQPQNNAIAYPLQLVGQSSKGLAINSSAPNLCLHIEQLGLAICDSWFVTSVTANLDLTVIETFIMEQ